MTNPFTSILEQPDLWVVASLNNSCPVSHRVCHDEIEMWVVDKAPHNPLPRSTNDPRSRPGRIACHPATTTHLQLNPHHV